MIEPTVQRRLYPLQVAFALCNPESQWGGVARGVAAGIRERETEDIIGYILWKTELEAGGKAEVVVLGAGKYTPLTTHQAQVFARWVAGGWAELDMVAKLYCLHPGEVDTIQALLASRLEAIPETSSGIQNFDALLSAGGVVEEDFLFVAAALCPAIVASDLHGVSREDVENVNHFKARYPGAQFAVWGESQYEFCAVTGTWAGCRVVRVIHPG